MNRLAEAATVNEAVSRRAFLKRVGVAATAMLAASMLASRADAVAAEASSPAQPSAMLIDLTRCTGCDSCALACKAKNDLPNADVAPQMLGNDAYTFVAAVEVDSSGSDRGIRYAKRQCMHCLEPACVAACPAAAMYKSEEGPVVYRPHRCLGCRYCQVACPFDVPAFDWDNPITPRISKCWFCYDRQLQGQQPACVAACPTGALRFGHRDELLAQAHGRIGSNPERYVDHVFGEYEVGGTSMLYLSDIPFDDLDLHVTLEDDIPPAQTEKVMRTLPAVIVGVGALAAGTAAYTHRIAPARNGTEPDSTMTTTPTHEQED